MAAPDVPEAAVSDAEAARFRATGVLHKPRFFTGEEAAAMRRCVETLQRRGLMGNILRDAQTENLQMAWLSHHSRLFQVLPWEGRVAAALRRLLPSDDVDAGVEVHYDQLFLKPAVTGAGTAWHADQAYFKLRRPERGVALWIALPNSTVANGTLHTAPWREGQPDLAHRQDPEQHGHELTLDGEAIPLSSATPAELPPGGVCFFGYGVPHCTLPNPTANPR